jgi:hypothetical protein
VTGVAAHVAAGACASPCRHARLTAVLCARHPSRLIARSCRAAVSCQWDNAVLVEQSILVGATASGNDDQHGLDPTTLSTTFHAHISSMADHGRLVHDRLLTTFNRAARHLKGAGLAWA